MRPKQLLCGLLPIVMLFIVFGEWWGDGESAPQSVVQRAKASEQASRPDSIPAATTTPTTQKPATVSTKKDKVVHEKLLETEAITHPVNFPAPVRLVSEMEGDCLVHMGTQLVIPTTAKKLLAKRAPSVGECAEYCKKEPGCQIFMFQYWDVYCIMFDSEGIESSKKMKEVMRRSTQIDTGRCASPGKEEDSDNDEDKNYEKAQKEERSDYTVHYNPAQILDAFKIPFLCTPNVSNHAAWRKRIAKLPVKYSPRAEFHPPLPEALTSTWYCDKIGNPLTRYTSLPLRYQKNSLVVGLYSGESIIYSRASICLDTWLGSLSEGKKFVFTSSSEQEAYGVETLGSALFPLREYDAALRPEREASNAQRLQLWGLSVMYEKNPDADWYLIVGDDTYVETDFMLSGLQRYDSDELLWLAPVSYHEVSGKSDGWKWILRTEKHKTFLDTLAEPVDGVLSNWAQRYLNYEKKTEENPRGHYEFEWSTGATGWILSRSAAKLYHANLPYFMKIFDIDAICYCPDLLTGFFLSLLGMRITLFDHMKMHPYAVDSVEVDFSKMDEVTLYHYVYPGRMAGIQERALHSKIDRLVIGGQFTTLKNVAKEFYKQHLEVAGRRLKQLREFGVTNITVTALPIEDVPQNVEQSLETRVEFVTKFRAFVTEHFSRLRRWQSLVLTAVQKSGKKRVSRYDIP